MADFTLYNAPQSTCSQRVRFVLNAKNLPFKEIKLDLFAGDQLKPDYLAINPNGVVPALLHDGHPVTDSAVITEYLDELYPEPAPFRPSSLYDIARMRSLMRYIDEVPTPAIRVPSYNLAFLPHFQAMSEEEFQALAESKPLRKEFLLSMGRTGFPEKEMNAARDRLSRAVVRMDETITASGGPWLMGETLTLPDVALMPVIVRLDDINLNTMWQGRPSIQRWLDAIRAHPAFRPTYYHGALLTEKYPHLAKLKRERA
ncbi:glutathione S-transferase family protein [Chelativorans salis]|uniref:Glutathione S-transferase family protein n=1 Tax=Chelativorans salis TaxID=2978478 RepID=A0ABT2LV12_9HYPH|nr:glutathione S-transferase family protein [Chelativorans sp. EGI FJ00035]MCT7377697.1 glutathione S-transferase family protein [Chelativorans sp. EGI FJ00035]